MLAVSLGEEAKGLRDSARMRSGRHAVGERVSEYRIDAPLSEVSCPVCGATQWAMGDFLDVRYQTDSDPDSEGRPADRSVSVMRSMRFPSRIVGVAR